MKSELRLTPHSVQPGKMVVEVWHDGQFIATIAGGAGPGVRIITKHTITVKPAPDDGSGIHVLEVGITLAG